MTVIQLVLIIFLFFALSRAVLRFRGRQITLGEFILWTGLFLGAILVIVFPDEIAPLANRVGIGRGVDLVIYVSIIVLFYLVFRLYVYLEDLRHEITEIIRLQALKNAKPSRK